MSDPSSPGSRGDELQFGLYLPQIRTSFADLEQRVRTAEELGFGYAWFLDHLWTPGDPQLDVFEGWTTVVALAMRTSTIRLGHLVLCAPFRPPALLAKMVATLDVISGGRFDLGLGWGSVPAESVAFGIPTQATADKAQYLRETVHILRLMFAGEPFSYHGEVFDLVDAVGRPTPLGGTVPLHIGGSGPKRTMPLVRELADWWNCPSYGADQLAELVPLAGQARISVQRPVCLVHPGDDRDHVVATAQRRFGWWGGLIAGTPSEVAHLLAADAALGAEMFVIQLTDFASPASQALFMDEVVPDLRALVDGG